MACEDYLVSHETFTIQQCGACSFRLTNPRPDVNSTGGYYESDDYISHNDKSGGLVNTAYKLVRNYTLRAKLSLINKLNGKPGHILDVGCGTGAFLETCQSGGWVVTGMEPDEKARVVAKKKLNAEIQPNLSSVQDSHPFDVITLWHVLEHIPNLNETIAQLHELLSANGTLLIAVPNSDSYDAQYFNKYWAAYDVPRHLSHFTPSTIQQLFKKHNFRVAAQKPMLFDAFYIAMLSTRYETGKTDYVRSIKVGLNSNRVASKTGNASSQIYLFKKE